MKLKGYLTVLGAVLINSTTVSMYLFGNLNTYLVSYIRMRRNSSVVMSDGMWLAASSSIAFGVGSLPIKKIASHLGPKQVIIFGCFIISGGVMSSFATVKRSLEEVVATFGFTAHIGFCVMYLLPGSIGIKYLSKWRKLIGIVNVTATAVGAFLFNEAISAFINPSNVSPDADGYFKDEKVIDRVPYVFLLLGFIYFAFQLVGSILLYVYARKVDQVSSDATTGASGSTSGATPTKDGAKESKPMMETTGKGYGSNEGASPTPQTTGTEVSQNKPESTVVTSIKRTLKPTTNNNNLPNMNFKEVLKYKEFYILYLINFLHTQSYFLISNSYKPFAFNFYRNDHAVVAIGSVAATVGVMGRIAWFYLMKVASYKILIIGKALINAVLIGTLYLTKSAGVAMFSIWMFIIFFLTGALFVISPLLIGMLFGPKNQSTQNGMVLTQYIISGITVIAGTTSLKTTFTSWSSLFTVICIAEAMSGVLACFLPSDPLVLRKKLTPLIITKGEKDKDEKDQDDALTTSNIL